MSLVIILISGFLFMFFNEMEDECIRNKWTDKFYKWNSTVSWKNKWSLDENQNPISYKKKWYHFGIEMPYEERYPYGSTFFVGFSDAEHFFQMMKIFSICLGFSVFGAIEPIIFFVGHLILGVAKETIFKKFLT